jgi:hypothetical protein
MIKVAELPAVRGLREALHHWCVVVKQNGIDAPVSKNTHDRYSAELPEFEEFAKLLAAIAKRTKYDFTRVWWHTYAYRGDLLKTRYGFKWEPDPESQTESCVRKNMNLVGPDGYFIGYHSRDKYQSWRKHLYTKKGVCRRCNCPKAAIKIAEEVLANPDAPWKRPLVITPVDQRG